MENYRRNRRTNRKTKPGLFEKIFSFTSSSAEEIEDQDWYLDSMDVRLTRIYNLVLILHVVAVGGIIGFKMLENAASPAMNSLAQAETKPSKGMASEKVVSGKAELTRVAKIPPSAGQGREDRYCVLPGDTLSTIATKLNITTQQLCLTNHITSPDEILPGMWLKIPTPVVIDPTRESIDGKKFADHPVAVVEKNPDYFNQTIRPGNQLLYPVKKGDTISGIAQKFGVRTKELMEYNEVERAELLQIGQILKIPRK